jgi:hypothetical protein
MGTGEVVGHMSLVVRWDDTCGVCGNTSFWWTSKVRGFKVCMRCVADPIDALVILARYGKPGLVAEVLAWQRGGE